MTLPALLALLAVFLLLTGIAMWLLDRALGLLGCLRDWGVGTFVAGAAAAGLSLDTDFTSAGQVTLASALLSTMFFVAGGFVVRGLASFANGREQPVLNTFVRWLLPLSVLFMAVHTALALSSGRFNAIWFGVVMAGFSGVGAACLARALVMTDEKPWLSAPLRGALGATAGLTTLALTGPIVIVSAGYRWYAQSVSQVQHAMVAVLIIGLTYALFWLVFTQYRAQVEDLAGRDELTGALNRNGLVVAVRRHFSVLRATPIVALQIDIDHFHRVNEDHGHPVGDRVLREIARALRVSCRSDDFVARTGGEEFTVVCVGASAEAALDLAERIRTRIADTEIFRASGEPVRCSVSIGLSGPCENYSRWREAWRQADNALYRAKSLGCNISISYQPEVSEAFRAKR